MSAAAPNQSGTWDDPRKAAGEASPAAGPFGLARWADPEWPLFVAVLLLPALLFLAAGQFQKASFFAGAAVYVGVLKWLGWLVFTRPSLHRPAFTLFPLEMFLGLALLCGWFYLRNLAGWFWPASYGLWELAALPVLAFGLHALDTLFRARAALRERSTDLPALRRALFERAAMYVPFCLVLVVALWSASGVLHVQTTDQVHHAFSARVYLHEGLFFDGFAGGHPIIYASGFGAVNAATAAVSPLSVVQAVNLQHVLLLTTGLFLVTGAVVVLAGRPLGALHLLAVPFVALFPMYALYPDHVYQGIGRQAGPPLLLGVCLLPLLTRVAQARHLYLVMAAGTLLAVLAAALNPSCVPFAALAGTAALVVWCFQARALSQRWPRVLAAQSAMVLVAGGAVLACDQYYGWRLHGAEAPLRPAGAGGVPVFSAERAAGSSLDVHPLKFGRDGLMTTASPHIKDLMDWPSRLPQAALPPVGLALGVAALAAAWRERRPLWWLVAGCLLAWLPVKTAVTALAGGLSVERPDTHLLAIYLVGLLIRWELLLLFLLAVAAAAVLYLRVGEVRSLLVVRRALVPVGLAALGCVALADVVRRDFHTVGHVSLPVTPYFAISADDLNLTAWVEENLPPARGWVGLAAVTITAGPANDEKHIYAEHGAQALLYYGRHYNLRFGVPPAEPPSAFDDYEGHVARTFDPVWCRANGIHWFYVTQEARRVNPGLDQAIADGRLRPLEGFGDSWVYEVVPAAADATVAAEPLLLPSPPVLRGRGVGGEGAACGLAANTPSPQPLAPEYGGEGLSGQTLRGTKAP